MRENRLGSSGSSGTATCGSRGGRGHARSDCRRGTQRRRGQAIAPRQSLSTPVQPGDAIMGSLQWEAPPGCSGGSLDTITLGSQQATILQTINPSNFGQDFCCASVTYFILFNASGTRSSLTVSSSNGRPFSPIGIGVMAEVSRLPSTAMVDAYNGNFTNSATTGNDALTSGAITPSAAGDFLYGFQLSTYAAIGALTGC